MEVHVITAPQAELRLPGEFAAAAVDLRGVDWEREIAVVLDLGEQRTGGHAVVPRGVRVEGGDAYVDVEVRRPAPGSFVIQAITRPTALVRVPRAGLGPAAHVIVRDQVGRELARRPVG